MYFIVPPKATEALGEFFKNSKLKSHKTNFSFPVEPLFFIQQIFIEYFYELGTIPYPGDQDT